MMDATLCAMNAHPSPAETPELLTVAQFAELLSVHPATLATWRYEGRGPRFIKVGRHVRYRLADINTWLDEQARSSTRPQS